MNVLGLCSGTGALELGIRIAVPGARGIAHVEREAYACAVLRARMEDGWLDQAPVWSDLATFDARPWRGVVDCVASGDPCQPNSPAGKRLGADDDRFLIDQVLRVVDECRPDRVFRENVPGNVDGQLADLIGPLEGLGYRVAAGIFSAAEIGASHRRERLFVMADRAGSAMDDAENNHRWRGKCSPEEASGAEEIRRRGPSGSGHALADAGSAGLQGRELGRSCDRHRDGPDAHGSAPELRRAWLPPFAPGPADPGWCDIIAAAPELEPAVGKAFAKPLFRGMATRLADRIYGDTDNDWRSCEALQRLWEGTVAQAFWCAIGRPWSVSETEILRSLVHGGGPDQAGRYPLRTAKAVRSFEDDCLQGLSVVRQLAASPCRPRLEKQRAEESTDALRILSHETSSWGRRHQPNSAEAVVPALRASILPSIRAALQHLSDQEASWSGTHRVDRLRACGNGVVPLAAAYAWRSLDALLAADAAAGQAAVSAAA